MSRTGQPSKTSFAIRKRARKTRRIVKVMDVVAFFVISLGGIGTIAAVSLVFIFLFSVAVPLFFSPAVNQASSLALTDDTHTQVVSMADSTRLGLDEYLTLGWTLDSGARLQSFKVATGEVLEATELFPNASPTAIASDTLSGSLAFGFADGSIVLGTVGVSSSFVEPSSLANELRAMPIGNPVVYENGILVRSGEEQFRLQKLEYTLESPLSLATGDVVRRIDTVVRGRETTLVALTESGTLHIKRVDRRKNLMTGKESLILSGGTYKLESTEQVRGAVHSLKLSGVADAVYLVWTDGHLVRLDTRNINQPVVAERLELLDDTATEVTAVEFMIGRTTLVVGDSKGGVRALFRIKPTNSTSPDGSELVVARRLQGDSIAEVTALGVSARTRMLAVGYADGLVSLFQMTSGELLADIKSELSMSLSSNTNAVTQVAISPKDDSLFAVIGANLQRWELDLRHPSVSFRTIFTPVWYEGYETAEHVWQSSSGTDDFEEKYGLVPLIFGTLKATFYSMLFGAPLALLAAIYTSEFLKPRVKAKIKPTIEMMASLPSVVLGFLAALVFAPFVENVIVEVLIAFAIIPLVLLVSAYCWQLCSKEFVARNSHLKLWFILAALALAVGLTSVAGPVVESLVYAGDIRSWLDGQVGSGFGGWILLFLPLSAFISALSVSRLASQRMQKLARKSTREQLARADFLNFLVGVGFCFLLASGFSLLLTALGLDPRGSFVDTYVQRNALVVGFVMGFAIIPIIYTIADDALSSVPEHLRAASLGCGATPWQTAVRIIVPTAMSGLFSAVMIGLGRAVGETMIVLMAAGNTPVMDLNIFNGFRTLSANIAVELPEAVQHGTHYRMLFLAALSLFFMTFIVNTIAEVIRLRFRKRAFQL